MSLDDSSEISGREDSVPHPEENRVVEQTLETCLQSVPSGPVYLDTTVSEPRLVSRPRDRSRGDLDTEMQVPTRPDPRKGLPSVTSGVHRSRIVDGPPRDPKVSHL